MNLEGKQQIWKDYQKEIADDHYFYARSCIRQTFFPGSEWAYLDIMKNKLGKDVIDDPRHTTCTGIGYHSDIVPVETIMTVVARHFALMTEAGYENMTPSCITSFGIYTEILETRLHQFLSWGTFSSNDTRCVPLPGEVFPCERLPACILPGQRSRF